MANKDFIMNVKTNEGYDSLYPLTPYQIHYATNVTGDGSNYDVTIDLPAENAKLPMLVYFVPNTASKKNCTINVNGIGTKNIIVGGSGDGAQQGELDINIPCLVCYGLDKDGSFLGNYARLLNVIPSTTPRGIICMWSGSSIPKGWHLCDGTNGTPDLRDRFVVGAGNTYNIGNTGGEATHKLTTNEMPNHTHTLDVYAGSSAGISFPYLAVGSSPVTGTSGRISTNTVSGVINSTGGGAAHENRPPYYALAFIMKL